MKIQKIPTCPCGTKTTISPQIVKGAEIGVISEYFEDQTPYDLIRRELVLAGVQPTQVTFTSMWLHPPPDVPDNAKCLTWNTKQAIKAVKGCRIVLLVGPDANAIFLSTKVSEVVGTWQSANLLPDTRILPLYNPTSLIHGTIGEWRLAMRRLTEELSSPSKKSSKKPKKATVRRSWSAKSPEPLPMPDKKRNKDRYGKN